MSTSATNTQTLKPALFWCCGLLLFTGPAWGQSDTFSPTEVGFYNDLDNSANNFSTELRDGKRVPKAGSGKAWFDAQGDAEGTGK